MSFSIPNRMAHRLKALVLIGFAIYFTQKFVSGTLYYYISPRFGWLTILAVILLILLAGSYNMVGKDSQEHHHHDDHVHDHEGHSHGKFTWFALGIVALPLILGVVIPSNPLDASAVATRGVTTNLTVAAEDDGQVLGLVPSERNVLDWVRAMSLNPDPASLNGQEANLVGFVYRDIQFTDDQMMVARFTLSCCVADATAIGVVVQSDVAAQFEQDTWVQVTGTFQQGTLDGNPIPVLVADTVEPVEEPLQPYLYQ